MDRLLKMFAGRGTLHNSDSGMLTPVVFLALLFLACSCAWGACHPGTLSGYYCAGCANSWGTPSCCYNGEVLGSCDTSPKACNGNPPPTSCAYSNLGYLYGPRTGGYCQNSYFYSTLSWSGYCDTQAEADSVYCAQNPQAEGCEQEQDTTLYYCKQEYSTTAQTWKAYIFKCSCKQAGGTITGCNGKQNVDVVEDCTPYKALNGDCAQNGYNSGANGARDSTGKNVQCFAAIGSNCIMRDKASGNTFTCAGCDGSCDYAMRKIADGSCVNPYPPPPETGDTP